MNELIGQYIGNYQLSRFLSQEGIIETYLGEHKHLHTKTMVKTLAIQLTEEQATLFQRKVEPIAELMHKHIVRLLDSTVQQNRPFLLQDYFPAGTLRKVHPYGSRVVLRQVLSHAKQLADALHYIHSRQIVHGDVRPENVMLGWESTILLNDTGLADLIHTLAPESNYPPTEAFAYLAPEQFQGQILPASDQYALAVMVYEWLCGETPFQGSFSEIIAGHLTMPPPALSTKATGIPGDIEQVIMIALAKDPIQRFASIQAFATALELAGKSTSTSSPGVVTPTPATPIPALSETVTSPPEAPLSTPSDSDQGPSPAAIPLTSLPDPQPLPGSNTATIPAEAPQTPAAQRSGMSRRATIATLALGGIGLVAVSAAGTAAR